MPDPGPHNYVCNVWNGGYTTAVVYQTVPEPKKPEVQRLPDGRLPYINPINLCCWTISPSCEDESSRTKTWKLSRKGWVGLATHNLSRWEERAMKKFIAGCQGGVYRCRMFIDRCGDERPGDIGTFVQRCQSFYFEHEAERAEMIRLINEVWPKRTDEMLVNTKRLPPEVARLLRAYNWHFSVGSHGSLITMEPGVPATVIMTIKLLLT